MPNLTLQVTAQRLIDGTTSQIALKEHIDEWNRTFDARLFEAEPPQTGQPHLDAWLAAMAEYEAAAIRQACPSWANSPDRFLSEPVHFGGTRSRAILIEETPSAWSRRGLFPGPTWIKRPKEMDFIKMTLGNVNTSYRTTMTESDLEKFMLREKAPPRTA